MNRIVVVSSLGEAALVPERHRQQDDSEHQERGDPVGALEKGQIEEKSKRIQALQKEIESHRKVVEQRTKEISVARVKVEQTQNDFHASYDALVGQIKSDLKKIETYLSQPKNN